MNDVQTEYQEYCLCSGHLFNTFGRLENVLTSALKLHLALKIGGAEIVAMRLASAIYGSMRFKASRDTIKRILEVEDGPLDRSAFLTGIFEQVAHIEFLRDKIAHQMVVPAHRDLDGFWQVSDAVTTRDIRNLKVWVFDTHAIQAAADDLVLAAQLIGGKPIAGPLFSELDNLSPPTWQYKPSMLKLVPHSKLRNPPPQ